MDALTTPPAAGEAPLAGLVVADLSRVLAGPYCTMLLGDLGARVIKIEGPHGDDTRTWRPPERDGESTYFLSVNRNKESIALDLADPHDRETAHRIVERADVLVENFKPGGLVRFGLDYASVSARHRSLVYASISGFGAAGGADLPGYDLIAQALSGMMDLTGRQDDEPTKVGVALIDVVTGLHACVGILSALHRRDRTGEGEYVQVNLLSSALSSLVNHASAVVAGGRVPTRMGNAHPSLYPYEPFPTRDAPIVIAAGNDAQFVRLCDVLGIPDAAADPRFATMPDRNRHRDELRELLHSRLRLRGAGEWFDELRAARIPAAPILDIAAGVGFATDLGLRPVAEAGSGQRKVPTIRNPIGLTQSHISYRQAPPHLDADAAAVRAWLDASPPWTPSRP